MNELDKRIEQARAKRFIVTIVLGGVLLVALLNYIFWLFPVKGYSIDVMPADAKASHFIKMKQGAGFYFQGVLYTLSDKLAIEVGAKDFESKIVNITPTTRSTLYITLEPSPGTLIGNTEPSDVNTAWTINGELVHIGENLEHRIPPGNYNISINNTFYQPINDTLILERNQTVNKSWALETVKGHLTINTTPVNGDVYINKEWVGTAPIIIEKPSGNYDIKVVAEGYETTHEVVEINNKTTYLKRQYKLEPQKGTLSLTISPEGGELIVGGVAVGESRGSTFNIPVVANTTHSIHYSKPGYFDFSDTATVTPGENKALAITLKKEIGMVNINTFPAAAILIDGKPEGQGTLIKKLPAVKHKLEFVLPGYRSQVRYVIPSSKSAKTIKVNMLTEFEARRKEGKPLFVSTLGIVMQQVKPTQFTMGSPANEKGRKRNEFQIKVGFSRKIWVSRHEITEAQYAVFDASKPNSKLPVTDISWSDAVSYCNWLSEKEGLPVFYQMKGSRIIGFNVKSKGYRLLTEAEWEWLAKKSKRSLSTVYPWGNHERIPKNTGNFADKSMKGSVTFYLKQYEDGFTRKAPVGSFKADRLGLYDLAGNVSEWVHDRYTNTPPSVSGIAVDYMGATRGVEHIVKGASYQSGRLAELRSAYKESSKSGTPTIGFRIARYH
ncbi:hypothetical protein AB835_00435 [Candidatus Endobugula sertula]|uniref:PEGA domain-containing protein n=1 Tax=Candidatus Endobugula sertula TaxID=62101 RepID=A0A1D2QTW8_9GAMM|nr:hypothetical protein AB835_00435 [Candidatus Endobugula sertula]